MKKSRLTAVLLLAFLMLNVQLFAYGIPVANGSIAMKQGCDLNVENEILAQVNELDALVEVLNQNPELDYNDVCSKSPELVENVNAVTRSSNADNDLPLGIPSFLWGCAFGVVGIILVYIFTDSNKVEAKKALNGCIAAYAIVGVLYIAFFATMINSTPTYNSYNY